MDEILFFPKTVHREVRILTYLGLIGKAPEKSKRLKLTMAMPLSGRTAVGMPGWLGDDFEYVSKTHNTAHQHIEFPGVNLEFSADDLFSNSQKAQKASLSKFTIVCTGEKEDPEVELRFIAYVPYASGFLSWCGQMAGDLVWANFDLIGGASVTASDPDEDEDAEETPATAEETALFGGNTGLMSKEHDEEFAGPALVKGKSRKRSAVN